MPELDDKKKEKRFNTTQTMLEWQYFQIIGELQELQRHDSDPTCPCRLSDDLGENCLAKHSLGLSILAAETAAMETDKNNAKLLWTISEEAKEHHQKIKGFLCHKEDAPEFGDWSRQWRKKFEPIYYRTCAVKGKVKDSEGEDDGIQTVTKPAAHVEDATTDKIDSQLFGIKLAAAEFGSACPEHSTERSFTGIKKEIDKRSDTIENLVDTLMNRPAADKPCPPAKPCPQISTLPNTETWAPGIDTENRYTFKWKIIDAHDLIISTNPDTFAVNPKYPADLQPRERDRAGYQVRAQKRAAVLNPEQLLTDTHSISTSTPIIGNNDSVVECGNGRIISMFIAAKQFPEKIVAYKEALKKIAPSYGLPVAGIDKMKIPVLVRARIGSMTMTQRQLFAEECNRNVTEASSPIEVAKSDAKHITPSMLESLIVLENESIKEAIRAARNHDFVRKFSEAAVPDNERNAFSDAKGDLSSNGVDRIARAIFVATFHGETGLRLGQDLFESTDDDILVISSGIARSLAVLAKAEGMVAAGDRNKDYEIAEDLSKVIEQYRWIKNQPKMTIDSYLHQQSFDDALNEFQKKVLKTIGENSRSGKRIGMILSAYAQLVVESTSPNQTGFMMVEPLTKSELWDQAVRKSTVELSDIAALFDVAETEMTATEMNELHKLDITKAQKERKPLYAMTAEEYLKDRSRRKLDQYVRGIHSKQAEIDKGLRRGD